MFAEEVLFNIIKKKNRRGFQNLDSISHLIRNSREKKRKFLFDYKRKRGGGWKEMQLRDTNNTSVVGQRGCYKKEKKKESEK